MPTGTRKFILACFGSGATFILAYLAKVSGAEWVSAQALILGLYGAANVMDKKLGGAG